MVDGGDGPGETKSNEDASGVSSSESSNRSVSILSTVALGSAFAGGAFAKRETNGNKYQTLNSGSGIKEASNSSGEFKYQERYETNSDKSASESRPSITDRVSGNSGEESFPWHAKVVDEGFKVGAFFIGVSGGLLELLSVGELNGLA